METDACRPADSAEDGSLLLCPLCAGDNIQLHEVRQLTEYWFACDGDDCGVTGPMRGTAEEARVAWNTRASPSDAADLAAARALHEGKTPEAWRLLAWGNLSALRDCQKLVTERDARIEALEGAARNILPYLEWYDRPRKPRASPNNAQRRIGFSRLPRAIQHRGGKR